MQRCTTCGEYKKPQHFIEESSRCDECRNRPKLKKKAKPKPTSDFNSMEYVVGMFIGEYSEKRFLQAIR